MSSSSILIVGAGPVGLFLALQLAQAKITVTLLELSATAPDANDKSGSKAVVYQPPVYPLLKQAGVFDELVAMGVMKGAPEFRMTKTKEVVLEIPTPPGAPGILSLPQFAFCGFLEDKLKKMENVKILRGRHVVSIKDDGDSVTCTAETTSGTQETFSATYLVGADGAKSFIRKAADIAFEGITLPASQCVATDVRYPFEKLGFSHTQFLIDPVDFGIVAKISEDADDPDLAAKGGLWRASFNLPNETGMEDIMKALPGKFERMFPGAPKKGEYDLVHVAPYQCRQLVASTMVKGNILLVGDAAHLTNPYAGLGLTTGFFDAASLSSVLISILNRNANPTPLLKSWSEARIKVFTTITDPISRAAFFRVQKDEATVHELFEKDPVFRAVKEGKMAPPPSLATVVGDLDGFVA